MVHSRHLLNFVGLLRERGLPEAAAHAIAFGSSAILDRANKYKHEQQKRRIVQNYSDDERYLNVGGGAFVKNNWRVLDYYSEFYDYDEVFIDFNVNLEDRERWPIERGSYDIVYSSHTLEHLTDGSMRKVLDESKRILKPGGVLRINVPDIDLALHHYERGTMSEFNEIRFPYRGDEYARARCDPEYVPEFWLLHFFANHLVTHFTNDPRFGTVETESKTESDRVDLERVRRDWQEMEAVEFLEHYKSQVKDEWHQDVPGAHRNWYNYDRLEELLTEAGFGDIERGLCRQSRCIEMCTAEFDKRPAISVFVEAVA